MAHTYNGNSNNGQLGFLIANIVTIKFIDPNRLLKPAKCSDNITKSIEAPEWLSIPLKGK